MENIKKMQIEYLDMKTAMNVMKNLLDGINSISDIAKEKKSEFSDVAIEHTQYETYREKTE